MNQKKITSLKGDLRNVKNYLSLKLISEMDKNVDKEAVENFLFNEKSSINGVIHAVYLDRGFHSII